ncbi:hypothetical protein FKW77_000267 [Venturia effusa]|uniref:F-box domain-containing protein n=1 Tax=Venturia effusa TaxID=50376 RepID=A0A517L6I8_9PEZI|nr:hypothetical protein FKW77_000267 [Venturia effusa]
MDNSEAIFSTPKLRSSPCQNVPLLPLCEKVFSIRELWLIFLEFLPDRDVLRIQQVCRLFKDRINNDLLCQQRLFLQRENGTIDNSKHRRGLFTTDAYDLKLNPFLAHISIPPFIDWDTFVNRTKNADPRPKRPLMQAWDVGNKHICIYPIMEGHPDSRWKHMLVTQPPVTSATLAVPGGTTWDDPRSQYPEHFIVFNPAGLTIGDIVQEWRKATQGNAFAAGSPLVIAIHAWASYQKFYSPYRTTLLESTRVLGRSFAHLSKLLV